MYHWYKPYKRQLILHKHWYIQEQVKSQYVCILTIAKMSIICELFCSFLKGLCVLMHSKSATCDMYSLLLFLRPESEKE